MKLTTLYSLAKTGKVQEWTIEINGPKYRTHSGQVDGAITTSEWTVCEGKNQGRGNATQAHEQAFNEAQAKWKKKLDKNHFTSLQDLDNGPKFIEPMLAKNYDDYKDSIEFPVYSQPKLDGIRCIATVDGLYSRNGKEFVSVPHIFRELQKVWKFRPELVFDGEIYANKYANDFNQICSIAKKTKPTQDDLRFSAANIEYHVYDLVDNDKIFSHRSEYVRQFINHHIGGGNCIKVVMTNQIDKVKQLDDWYEWYVANGYEGQMIRLDGVYENKRSKSLLKRKEFKDAEFEIVDVKEGVGNRSGMAGNMRLRKDDGTEFDSNIKGDFGLLKQYLDDAPYLIGKMAICKFFNLTPLGIPRFPFVVGIRDFE